MTVQLTAYIAIGCIALLVLNDCIWKWLSGMMMKTIREQRDLIEEQSELIDAMRKHIGIDA